MKALIIEDEKAALRNLKRQLTVVAPDMLIIGELDSVTDSIEWLDTHPLPDLVFLDIHLADGSAFEIFEHTDIPCPIIFTTAYDEYALRAFKVNSIDYLLKPIGEADLRHALDKLARFQQSRPIATDYQQIIRALRKEENYRSHLLVPLKGDKLLPLSVDSIQYCFISEGHVQAMDADGHTYLFQQTLDELSEQLNPRLFYRANRQYLIAKQAVAEIDLWFNGRLAVTLCVPTPERIIISKAKAAEFKTWLVGE
ncbi:MAG: LytTR family DNA-binding domain-containing protein [Parabacteroides sp.]|nr:LytTR family DNA-binding domain-containing protein [Parabacteroides sp.]MDD6836399.1 LytTR family DNA-binding domain-containing protein [bacterium]MDD7722795.1 LytTR family DNA-binding domain-containing protein [bacterium]MDY4528719.1 LytTR family DNA-binding domain-containing protein [Parabacteroides sp.]